MTSSTSVRRKLAIATWKASHEGRLYARMAVDATPLLAYCARQRAANGIAISPGIVVGMAFARAVPQVPAFHHRVVFGRLRPFPTYDVGFAVDIEDGGDLAPKKVCDVDTKTLAAIARELEEGAARLRAKRDQAHRTTRTLASVSPWFLLRSLLRVASLLNGGIGVRAFGQPAHPLGSVFVTNIGSFGLDEGYVAPVPFARVPLYVCVGSIADAPMAVDGQVVVRPRIVFTATADHRIVDGAHAAAMARIVRRYLADPDLMDAL